MNVIVLERPSCQLSLLLFFVWPSLILIPRLFLYRACNASCFALSGTAAFTSFAFPVAEIHAVVFAIGFTLVFAAIGTQSSASACTFLSTASCSCRRSCYLRHLCHCDGYQERQCTFCRLLEELSSAYRFFINILAFHIYSILFAIIISDATINPRNAFSSMSSHLFSLHRKRQGLVQTHRSVRYNQT